ncbi:MAG: hypothetical protein MJZ81_11850 [Bacteroidales bacterium]|nr:hypothetical protein [Bacteroidales bacterium]
MNYYDFLHLRNRDSKTPSKSVYDYFAEDDFVKYGRGGIASQNIIVDLPVEEYLGLCEPFMSDDSSRHVNLREKVDGGEIKRFESIPMLRIRQMEDGENAKVYGHDGRHRALLMKEFGYRKIPVRIYAENFCWGECPHGEHDLAIRGWPKWLWCQNDRNRERPQYRWAFPVKKEGGCRAYERGLS